MNDIAESILFLKTKQKMSYLIQLHWETLFYLTTSRGYSQAVHTCREHSSAVTPYVPPAAQGKPEHCAPA